MKPFGARNDLSWYTEAIVRLVILIVRRATALTSYQQPEFHQWRDWLHWIAVEELSGFPRLGIVWAFSCWMLRLAANSVEIRGLPELLPGVSSSAQEVEGRVHHLSCDAQDNACSAVCSASSIRSFSFEAAMPMPEGHQSAYVGADIFSLPVF